MRVPCALRRMHDDQRDAQVLGVDLGMNELAVLEELLAVVGGENDRGLGGQAARLEVGEELTQGVVDVADRGVVERLEVLDRRGRRLGEAVVDRREVRAGRLAGAGWRRPGPEHPAIALGRPVGVVHRVGVQEEEEPFFRPDRLEEGSAASEGALDVGVVGVRECRSTPGSRAQKP
jgi:hypothetical protein